MSGILILKKSIPVINFFSQQIVKESGEIKKAICLFERWPYDPLSEMHYSLVIFKVKLPELLNNLIA